MESAIVAAAAGAAAMLLLVAAVLLATRRRRSRADLESMLLAAQRESDDLRHRLDDATGASGRSPLAERGPAYLEELFGEQSVPAQREPDQPAWVITHVGEPDASPVEPLAVPDRLVLSATLGEPLVKVAAFSHGVRRALSAQARNRIWFEMRREVRSARRQRLRLRKQLLREFRARERSRVDLKIDDLVVEDGA